MNSNKNIPSISISDTLYHSLKIYQEENQLDSLDSAVVEILTQFFQLQEETQRYATIEQVDILAEKVDRLSQQVAALSRVNTNITSPPTSSPTQTIQPSQKSAIASEGSSQGSEEWEDFEDEPDEILYDFLEYQ